MRFAVVDFHWQVPLDFPSQSVGFWASGWRFHVVLIMWQVLVQLLRHNAPHQGNGGEDGSPLTACGRRGGPVFSARARCVISLSSVPHEGTAGLKAVATDPP